MHPHTHAHTVKPICPPAVQIMIIKWETVASHYAHDDEEREGIVDAMDICLFVRSFLTSNMRDEDKHNTSIDGWMDGAAMTTTTQII
mmetsp:Transcript_2739/g.7628  ORF Transcript_2739/g.7628 Transcript_2739/m.7628 type:complete len:87 (+) Transcript_2739:1665-1925(+)